MKTLAQPRDKAELLRRLQLVRLESTRRWGRMTVHQMVCHLADSFRMATGVTAVSHDTRLFNRTVLKWGALYLPFPWPPGILTRPEIDQLQGGTKPVDFASDVAQVKAQLEIFTGFSLDRRPHPYFGPMSAAAWLRWGYLHTDHHLRQFGA